MLMNISKKPWSNMIKLRISKLQLTLDKLSKKEPKTIEDAVANLQTKSQRFHGVYVISDPKDKHILYVGRTIRGKGKLWQRLYNHLHRSDSLKTFGLRGKAGRKKIKKYFVRFIGIGNRTDKHTGRRNLEFFAISVISPKHNKG